MTAGKWAAAAVVLAAVLAAGGWYVWQRGEPDHASSTSELPPATATVDREDLAETQQEDGTLGYGSSYQLSAARPGMLTWLPAEAATVTRGKPLYKVDNVGVPLFYGHLPFYRTLHAGVEDGRDVRELEQNLHELGYRGFRVDRTFTSNTADAVDQWQDDRGQLETGAVAVGEVVVLPGPVRVGAAGAQASNRVAPGQPLYSYTGTERTVTVDLDVQDQQLAAVGAAVSIELPSGESTPGTIASIGAVATSPSAGSGPTTTDSGTSTDATLGVTISLDHPRDAGTLDQAPVEVDFVSRRARDVLTVPISALLALSDGGYGVQVVDGDTSRIVAVRTGVFADTRVEVSGGGLTEGMRVGVPST